MKKPKIKINDIESFFIDDTLEKVKERKKQMKKNKAAKQSRKTEKSYK